ncbi:MAG TPA: hypothetical protein VKA46_21515 [Gemmataceae bacterium]|nr:hypothetical protein [Gemmataceae bacterium]
MRINIRTLTKRVAALVPPKRMVRWWSLIDGSVKGDFDLDRLDPKDRPILDLLIETAEKYPDGIVPDTIEEMLANVGKLPCGLRELPELAPDPR